MLGVTEDESVLFSVLDSPKSSLTDTVPSSFSMEVFVSALSSLTILLMSLLPLKV